MKFNKTWCALFTALVLFSSSAFAVTFLSDDDKTNISNGLNSFATTLLTVVPESSTQQNVWADAYIGKVFPSFPPHFGGGLTFGGTQLDMTGFKSAATTLISGYNSFADEVSSLNTLTSLVGGSTINMPELSFGDIPDTFFMPTASLDLRVGGLFLPFDIGLCAMMTNPSLFGVNLQDPSSITSMSSPLSFSMLGFDGTFDYLTIGADIRYAVFEGNLIIPTISVGGGYYYTKGEFAVSSSSDTTISGIGVQTTTANMNLAFKSQVAFLQVQASKSFAIVTVYGGLRGIVSSSTNTWAWDYSTANDGSSSNSTVAAALTDSDSDSGTVASGADSVEGNVYQDGKWDFSAIQPQLYGGIGFNFVVFQTALGACWDMRNMLWSGSFTFIAKL